MSSSMEHLKTFNSFVRTLLGVVVIGGGSAIGWFGYSNYTEADRNARLKEEKLAETQKELEAIDGKLRESRKLVEQQEQQILQKDTVISDQGKQIVALDKEVKVKEAEIQRLDTALRLHKMERRLARISVLEVTEDPESGKKFSRIQFQELNELDDPIGEPKEFKIEGDMIYVDYLVVKFDDQYVEQADLERGTSICMFNRIFGEYQKPKDGFYLDQPGTHPGAYARGSVVSDFEKKIWEDFWAIANDANRAAELGIRALHGDAVSIRVTPGKTYRITVRSSGGPEIEVAEDASTVLKSSG